ncbi:UDP-N-acetylglucosamine 1-carboxyvinyltransferase [candidate division CPR3 bacterium 4484_211]|uniref:UDP-N-acetylglucosamine 1-carboxyvinyltransferase n=1 Tax=candidate division CPR3 bacterium 4484_211 TaxID=1968527 RepID=A0A1W9NZL9_UNCC3|nr:MAG: UDP-N-acetylglucosamine 1-carboxyvinyltransferase [candidate division CPR3 bacterium 4484_211]
MSDIRIQGGIKLGGIITPSGNKNAVLPALCASLLTNEPVILHNVPDLTDVQKIVQVLEELGAKTEWDKQAGRISIQNSSLSLDNFDGRLPLGMRASLLLISPLLQRFKKLTIGSSIGGCTLGIREIDPHIGMLREMGMEVGRKDSRVWLKIRKKFKGAELWPDYMSVTATENVVMAAVLAEGETVLNNAASEPHVQDLCSMLNSMGAQISGIGSSRLVIRGVGRLHGTEFRVSSDHHEIATYLALGAATGGRIEVKDAVPQFFPLITKQFAKLGVEIKYKGTTAVVEEGQRFVPEKPFTPNYIPRIEAAPWPYFPADLLPLTIALSLKTRGTVRFWNKVYEGGLFWVSELVKMGAKIEICDPHRIIVLGPAVLRAGQLECPYIIRATVALMMAAMMAEGESELKNIDTIYRAHPNFLENLKSLGAQIERVGETRKNA